ncbi:MAG: ATP-dependent Clp protease proteolytic subunit [Lachnospiraceae bacterium]|nr:ATP-dependent Clp protease proteolytic subunit [Lachnospiraceae bacterium]
MASIIYESARGMERIPIEDEMLKHREIFLTDQVDADTTAMLIKELMFLETDDPSKEITLYINSPGGSVQDGLALYDLIMLLKSPVRTVCLGTCASMGAILFLAGRKREMMAHGRIMIHDPAFGSGHEIGGKKPHEIQAELDDLNRCRESLARIIADRTGKSLEEIYKVTAKDTYYSAEEAVEFGLATHIITKKGGF